MIAIAGDAVSATVGARVAGGGSKSGVGEGVKEAVTAEAVTGVGNMVKSGVAEGTGAEVGARVSAGVVEGLDVGIATVGGPEVGMGVGATVNTGDRDAGGSGVEDALGDKAGLIVEGDLASGIAEGTEVEMGDAAGREVGEGVGSKVGDAVGGGVGEGVREGVE